MRLTGEPVLDMDAIRAFYAHKTGFHPASAGVPRLSIEGRA
jgi:hypothetical protein